MYQACKNVSLLICEAAHWMISVFIFIPKSKSKYTLHSSCVGNDVHNTVDKMLQFTKWESNNYQAFCKMTFKVKMFR